MNHKARHLAKPRAGDGERGQGKAYRSVDTVRLIVVYHPEIDGAGDGPVPYIYSGL